MFSKSAQWYDLLYSFKDYREEAAYIANLLNQMHPDARTILDVACGTAEHARHLSQNFKIDGIDLNEELVRIARLKNPNGRYACADMQDFDLSRKYDVIMCLFSSIGYVKTIANVQKALTCFKKHLNADGCMLVEPWFDFDSWKPGSVHMLTAETKDLKICRMNVSRQDGDLSILDFHYLVGTTDGVQHLVERHELGLFSKEEMLAAFTEAGVTAEFREYALSDRGLYIARA
jgi:ubiquinone/menaquinone biosynthesis C-methylase UbiE